MGFRVGGIKEQGVPGEIGNMVLDSEIDVLELIILVKCRWRCRKRK